MEFNRENIVSVLKFLYQSVQKNDDTIYQDERDFILEFIGDTDFDDADFLFGLMQGFELTTINKVTESIKSKYN